MDEWSIGWLALILLRLLVFFFIPPPLLSLFLGESLRPIGVDESSSVRADGDTGNDGAPSRLAAQLRCVYTSECSGRSFSALVQALSTKPAANAQVS